MTKPKTFRNLVISIIFLSVGIVFAVQFPNFKSEAENLTDKPEKTTKIDFLSKQKGLRNLLPTPTPEETPHNVVAAFYDVQNFPTAKLLLNNKDIVAREIRPTLYNLDGNAMEVAPVWVEANSSRMINLQDWASLGGESFGRGSLKLFHTGKPLVIGSQVYLEDSANSLSFEERLAELGKFNSRRLESVWWMPRNQTQVTIILSNTSDQILSVTARLSKKPHHTGEDQIFTLHPHQTRVLDLRKDFIDGNQFANSEVVGLTLEHTGEMSALKAHGQIKDLPKGYSNIVEFKNPSTAKSSELHGTGLHLGIIGNEMIEPIVTVKNVGTERSNLTGRVSYTRADGTNGTISLNAVNLKGGEMRLLNMNKVIQRSRQEQIEIAGIEFEYDTAQGSVIVNTQSVSENLNQVFRVPMLDPFIGASSTGGYPFRIDETSNTLAYIKNTTDAEKEYVAYLTWENGGEYMIGLKKIAPHKTVQIDVKRLRDEQTPDERGLTIPLNQTNGQIKWTIRSEEYVNDTDLKRFELIGRSEQIDFTNGISSSYACQNCCQKYAYGYISSGGVTEAEVGDQIQFAAYESGLDCYGWSYSYQMNNDDVDWDSSNDNIATVNNLGLATIVGVGDVEIDGDWWVDVTGNYGNYCPDPPLLTGQDEVESKSEEKAEGEERLVPDCSVCQTIQREIGSDVDIEAKPKVTINVPSTATDGDTVEFSVTVQGGTPTGYQWSFTSPNGAGNNPQVNFTDPTSAETEAEAHWFAANNADCATSPPQLDTNHPYYNSKYKIKVDVTFQGGRVIRKDKDFTVNAYWFPAGAVGLPDLVGSPQINQNGGTYVVAGPGNLVRTPQQNATINVPTTSQFYNKTVQHENVHIGQWDPGQLLGNYVTVNGFMARINNFTDTNRNRLVQRIRADYLDYLQAEVNRAINNGDKDQAEIDAFAVSDPIAPQYAYQRCGRTTF